MAQEGRDVCTLTADSHCTAQTNTTLEGNSPPIRNLKKY